MLSEAPLSDPTFREKAAQYLFETAACPAVCVSNSAVLSLFASGRTRGIVVECGGGITCAVPVFEGFALDHATQRVRERENMCICQCM
jgi:centractin